MDTIYTYLIHDKRLYKIGQSASPYKRLADIQTANPFATLITYGDNLTESELHIKYDSYRVAGEWFDLPEDIVHEIMDSLILSSTGLTGCETIEQENAAEFNKRNIQLNQRISQLESDIASLKTNGKSKLGQYDEQLRLAEQQYNDLIEQHKSLVIEQRQKNEEHSQAIAALKQEYEDKAKTGLDEYKQLFDKERKLLLEKHNHEMALNSLMYRARYTRINELVEEYTRRHKNTNYIPDKEPLMDLENRIAHYEFQLKELAEKEQELFSSKHRDN